MLRRAGAHPFISAGDYFPRGRPCLKASLEQRAPKASASGSPTAVFHST